MNRLGLQLPAAMVDQPHDRVQIDGDGDMIAGQRLAKHRQIVIVAQQVCQSMGVLGVTANGRTADRREQPLVVPKVLDPLAPRVQILKRRLALS